MASLLEKFLNLAVPLRCPFCGRSIKGEDEAPCPDCRTLPQWLRTSESVFPGTNYTRCICVGQFEGPLRDSVHRYKFSNQSSYAGVYGRLLANRLRQAGVTADIVTWVPVSGKRRKERGYDQAELLAAETARRLELPAERLLKKSRGNGRQSEIETRADRYANVRGVYEVPQPEKAVGQRVLLIDDILTSGATLEEAAGALREAGAAEVTAAAFCRTPK